MDINTVTLTGRLGSDIELRETNNGTPVANVNLAVNDGFGDKQKTYWIGLTLWGKTAESAAQHLGKGRKIAVSGKLTQDEFTTKEGKDVRKTHVTVFSWTFADSKGGDSANPSQNRSQDARKAFSGANAEVEENDSDSIPF